MQPIEELVVPALLPLGIGADAFPLVTPLNRIFAARWAAASGNRAEAGRLLRFADAPFALLPGTAYTYFIREDLKRLARELGGPP